MNDNIFICKLKARKFNMRLLISTLHQFKKKVVKWVTLCCIVGSPSESRI